MLLQLTVALALGLQLVGLQCCAADSRPGAGMQTAFTRTGLHYIGEVTHPLLEKELQNLKIPDQSGGGFSVYDIQLTSFTLPDILPSITASKGVTVTTHGVAFSISARWRYKKFVLSLSGSVSMDSSGVSLTVSSVLERGDHGQFVLVSTGCDFNIDSLRVDFHGAASWLLNLFKGQIANKIKSELRNKACSSIRSAIDRQADAIVEKLPVVVPVGVYAAVNYSLVDSPTFTDAYISTRHKGEFVNRFHPVDPPYSSAPLPPPSTTDRMMYIWLTEYMASSASDVFTLAGAFRYVLSPETVKIPKELPCLSTKCLQGILPTLFKKFPNMEVVVEMDVAKPPGVSIAPDGIHGNIPGEIKVFVRANSTASSTLALALHVSVQAMVSAGLKTTEGKTNITFGAKCIKSEISVVESAIGDVDVKLLQQVVDVMSQAGMNILNDKGNQGFPLPTIFGTSFTNPSLSYGQGFLVIGTDFKYSIHHLARLYAA